MIGADFVIQPNREAGKSLVPAVTAALSGDIATLREQALQELKAREEILH